VNLKSYYTVRQYGVDEYVEKRSRFICAATPVKSEEEAVAFINSRRSQYWDATHNVYAYSLREGNVRRYSDDAEPQGTAGIPTLDALLKSEITDVCVVTTRYFGGILLGGGGLVRAYSHSAGVALKAAGTVKMVPVYDCSITCDYHMYGKLNSMLASKGAMEINPVFTDLVELNFCVAFEDYGSLSSAVTDASGGKCNVNILLERYKEQDV